MKSSESNSTFSVEPLEEQLKIDTTDASNRSLASNLTFDDGISLIVLNEITGKILLQKTFPTWIAFSFTSDLLWWLKRIQYGRIVVMFIKKSGIYGLSKARKFLKRNGSLFIDFLPPNSLWIWVWIYGGKTLVEVASRVSVKKYLNRNIWADFYLKLSNYSRFKPDSPYNINWKEFCGRVEGMGNICERNIETFGQFSKIYKKHKQKIYPRTNDIIVSNIIRNVYNNLDKTIDYATSNDIGIIVCAGNRYQYLSETLHSLLTCPGIRKENIFIVLGVNYYTGEADQNSIALLNLLKLPFEIVLSSSKNFKLKSIKYFNFLYYKYAWEVGLNVFRDKEYLAFVDEDVTVSKDWFNFLLHTAPILKVDKSVWCVTGTAAHGLGGPPNYLMRGWRQVGWGFLILRSEVQKTVNIWPESPTFSTLFDSWLLKEVSKNRECIFPAISHSHHFGIGLNIIPELHERYFINEPVTNGSTKNYTPINQLIQSNYKKFVNNSIRNSIPLIKDPCSDGFLEDLTSLSDFAFYFRLTDKWDAPEWTFLAECLGTWPYSTHGMHEGAMHIFLKSGRLLWLVGTPLSPYSVHKPKEYQIWTPDDEDFIEKHTKFSEKFITLPSFVNKSFEHLKGNIFH